MLEPTLPGWKVETIGDDIAWIRIGEDGRFYAVNPENGFFGVAPGTDYHTNPNAMRTIAKGGSIFTNVALTDDGDIWWEGMGEPPAHLTVVEEAGLDAGRRPSRPRTRTRATARRSASATPARRSGTTRTGVPLDAIFFGGRRRDTVPLVTEARDWQHGVFMGATLSSETTAAATGAVGVVRRDPMAMLPFIGYNAGDYFAHWIAIGKSADAAKLPKIFYVNWFRRDDEGNFVWPGFGENIRVIKWALERIDGTAAAVDTPIGRVPTPESLDVDGLDMTERRPARRAGGRRRRVAAPSSR